MAHKYELTWQSGIGGRAGRWRKKYRGRIYYFEGGRGKTDRAAYTQAIEDWKKLRQTIEDADEKPNESDYLEVLREWRALRDWASQNADKSELDHARGKIKELETRLAARRPTPITASDRFEARFELPIINLDGLIGRKNDIAEFSNAKLPGLLDAQGRIKIDQSMIDFSDGSPGRIAKEIWRDRIARQLRTQGEAETAKTVEANLARFLSQKRTQVACGDLSAGRFSNLQLHLELFRDFVGASNSVSAITSRVMIDYRTDLLDRVSRGELSSAYAKDRLETAKQFLRRLWLDETLAELPRVVASKGFTISSAAPEIKTHTTDEVKGLLDASSGQTKLCILLCLNTGMTQRDISDLRHEEVDWKSGMVRRKRSKTRKFGNVPSVVYQLWPETFRLLQEHRRADFPNVLANENGGPLLSVGLKENGKATKIDNIHTNYFRLCRRVGIQNRPFKLLRKTSATLLRGNEKYSGLEQLFLGHAPRSMSDRHYAGVPTELLGDALKWLASQFGIETANGRKASQKPQQKSHKPGPRKIRRKGSIRSASQKNPLPS
jgi:integrase